MRKRTWKKRRRRRKVVRMPIRRASLPKTSYATRQNRKRKSLSPTNLGLAFAAVAFDNPLLMLAEADVEMTAVETVPALLGPYSSPIYHFFP